MSIKKGFKNIVKYLIEHGADINDQLDMDKHSIVSFTCQHGNER